MTERRARLVGSALVVFEGASVTRPVRVAAPAKVNLHLAVGSLRADGYHRLDSVFHSLELIDELTIADAPALSFRCTPDVGVPAEQNLAVRAARAFAHLLGREPGARVELQKSIPYGAGLGGGSSDAAATILGLAHLWGVSRDDPRCLEAAVTVGADVPFFLTGGAALMTGRGDVLARRLPASDAPIVLVRPDRPVSTAAAYQAYDALPQQPAPPDAVISALESRDVRSLGAALDNNLQAAAISLVPEIGEVLEWLAGRGGICGVAVAGSGSTVFGVVESAQMAHDSAEAARARGWWSAATSLSREGARVLDTEGGA